MHVVEVKQRHQKVLRGRRRHYIGSIDVWLNKTREKNDDKLNICF